MPGKVWDISNSNYSKKDARQSALERIKEALDNNFTGTILLRCIYVLGIIFFNFVF
jgi:hypothetical protein